MTEPRRHISSEAEAVRAFTMIELIIVSVLMVVLAAVIVPRVVGGDERRAAVTVDAVRDLLSAAGQREALTTQAITLAFDAEAEGGPSLSLLRAQGPTRSLTLDPLLQPVRLEGLEVERCEAAGQTLNRRRWQIPLREGEIRPAIVLVLSHPEAGRWVVALPSEAAAATIARVTPGDVTSGLPSASIDLDQMGRREEAW